MQQFLRHTSESDGAYRQRMLIELAQMDKSEFLSALQMILRVSSDALHVKRAEFWRFTDDASELVCEMLYNAETGAVQLEEHHTHISRSEHPDYFRALIQQRSVVVHDVLSDPITATLAVYLQQYHIGALMDTSVWAGTKCVGDLCLEHVGGARVWTSEEMMFASFAAAMISLALEQSERTHREQNYRTLIENATDGIYRTDLHGRFIFANSAIHTMLGFSQKEVLGRQYVRFVHPDYRVRAVHFYHQQLKERIPSTYFEFPTLRKDGTEAWLGQNVQLVMEHGEAVGFQAVVRNISQRKLAEDEILKVLERERQLGELKSRFVSMVLHELRTPLTGISLNTEILQRYADKIDDQQKNKSYNKIFENIKRIMTLMDGVLLLSETETKKLTFHPHVLNIEAFCRELLDELSSDPELRSCIRFHVTGNAADIMADTTLLRHTIGHLLVNAVKYSLDTVDIHFTVDCTDTDTIFTISDRGIGIPADDLPFVFETFHRAKNAAELIPGTGVGLSVVKQCVAMHHGTIEVKSELDRGTTFTVKIPRNYTL
jgi:PAS domain S-box-containing protein